MLLLYNILILLLFLFSSPLLLFKLITDKRFMTGLSERLGILPSTVFTSLKGERPIWFHAASVGEIIASQRLLEGIRERWPDRKLLVSTFTPTGKDAAIERLGRCESGKVGGSHFPNFRSSHVQVIFLPLDLPWVTWKVLKAVNPSALILMETELWPNLINSAGRMGVPVVVVNGRISDRSYGKYRFISPLLKRIFAHINRFLMQSSGDAERIIALGADRSRVSVTGNIKFDMDLRDSDIPFMDDWVGPVFVAGSTRKGEDAPLLDIYKDMLAKHPALKLILAPRHLERLGEVEGILREKGLHYTRRSEIGGKIDSPVLLLDTIGELASFYKYGNLVFIGGSIVPCGGHNLLEPALYGRPVLFGPYIENFREVAQVLVESGGGVKAKDAGELRVWVDRLLSDRDLCESMGCKAREAVLKNQGATEKILEALSKVF